MRLLLVLPVLLSMVSSLPGEDDDEWWTEKANKKIEPMGNKGLTQKSLFNKKRKAIGDIQDTGPMWSDEEWWEAELPTKKKSSPGGSRLKWLAREDEEKSLFGEEPDEADSDLSKWTSPKSPRLTFGASSNTFAALPPPSSPLFPTNRLQSDDPFEAPPAEPSFFSATNQETSSWRQKIRAAAPISAPAPLFPEGGGSSGSFSSWNSAKEQKLSMFPASSSMSGSSDSDTGAPSWVEKIRTTTEPTTTTTTEPSDRRIRRTTIRLRPTFGVPPTPPGGIRGTTTARPIMTPGPPAFTPDASFFNDQQSFDNQGFNEVGPMGPQAQFQGQSMGPQAQQIGNFGGFNGGVPNGMGGANSIINMGQSGFGAAPMGAQSGNFPATNAFNGGFEQRNGFGPAMGRRQPPVSMTFAPSGEMSFSSASGGSPFVSSFHPPPRMPPMPRPPPPPRQSPFEGFRQPVPRFPAPKKKCRHLNPHKDSRPHPDTDRTCERSDRPGFMDDRCSCQFLRGTNDQFGCPMFFLTLCTRDR